MLPFVELEIFAVLDIRGALDILLMIFG